MGKEGEGSGIKDTGNHGGDWWRYHETHHRLKICQYRYPYHTVTATGRGGLLADAVRETKEKLETLKVAAEQANEALAKGEPIVGLGMVAVKTAADFDTAMSQVGAVSGATGKDLDALRDKAREMGSKTKFSASEAAEAMNYMAMAGWKTSVFRAIQERVYYLYREKKQPLLLAIDEALRQRITVHYNYEGLSDQEVPDYICHKLELAGGSRGILEGGAINAIHGYSEGNARKIDNLMTDALTIGAQQEQHCINAEIIMAAANNQALV